MKKYYITTPIYYVNDKPHIGHAYTSLICDIIARFYRLNNYNVQFVTGTDEHGQKIFKSATNSNKSPKEFCNEISLIFQDLSKKLNLSNNMFIRTTDLNHGRAVKHLWNELIKRDQIYLGQYEGWYSINEEAFYAEDELVKDNHGNYISPFGNIVEWIKQESYFFKLSQWQDQLLDFYKNNPNFIVPNYRLNEVISFVSSGLKDLSVSRINCPWGITVPDNERHTIYVWLDALVNYLSAIGYPNQNYMQYWPANLHVIGKDILRFHAVYWPAFLMAAEIQLPEQILVHGWWTIDGQKMSKSLGNVVSPDDLVAKYGLDPVRYFLVREFLVGKDGNFTHHAITKTINSDLSNSIGNLFQRTVSLIHKYFDSKIPILYPDANIEILDEIYGFAGEYQNLMHKYDLYHVLEKIIYLSNKINKYINDMEPWKHTNNLNHMSSILYISLESIVAIMIYLEPFIPFSSMKVLNMLKIELKDRLYFNMKIKLKSGTKIDQLDIIFPRIEY